MKLILYHGGTLTGISQHGAVGLLRLFEQGQFRCGMDCSRLLWCRLGGTPWRKRRRSPPSFCVLPFRFVLNSFRMLLHYGVRDGEPDSEFDCCALWFKIEGTADEGIEERKQVLPVKEVNWLCFSYRGWVSLLCFQLSLACFPYRGFASLLFFQLSLTLLLLSRFGIASLFPIVTGLFLLLRFCVAPFPPIVFEFASPIEVFHH